MIKKAVVTGANGFIGSALVTQLVRNNIEVIALDRQGCRDNIPNSDKVIFLPFDLSKISDTTHELKEFGADTYFHLAWFGMNGETRGDPDIQLTNALWTVEALKQASEIGCGRFVGAGSIMEYETFYAVTEQENKPGAAYTYGAAKLAARTLCMIKAGELGIDFVWAEITNAYGPGERSSRLINSTLRKIINDEPLRFTSAEQNYDFVYIDDAARAIRSIGEKGRPFCHYLIGSSDAKPLKEFLLQIKSTAAPDREFIFGDVPFTGVSLPLECFDCSRTEKDTGFRCHTDFSEGIRKTMEWLKGEDKK